MSTLRHPHLRNPVRAANAVRGKNAEWLMASLVLLAVAMSIVSSTVGFADTAGKEQNGVRRAASQLERKVVKVPVVRVGQVRIG